MELKILVKNIVEELEELQVSDIKQIDVYGKTSITDLFIVCSGRSTRHVKSVASKLAEKLKNLDQAPLSCSGLDTGEWALLDCGDIIVHIMTPEVRAFYNIEGLWMSDENSSESSNL